MLHAILSSMSKIILTFIITIGAFSSAAQGSWNIQHILTDSINENHLGKQIKIDFKGQRSSQRRVKKSIRAFVQAQDTCIIEIEGVLVELAERRKIYADHGDYKDQYLECLHLINEKILRIYNSEILEIKEKSILFKLNGELLDAETRKKLSEKEIIVWIDKNKIDGILTEIQ